MIPVIERLLAASSRTGDLSFETLAPAIRAVELHYPTFEGTRELVAQLLIKFGFTLKEFALLVSDNRPHISGNYLA